MKKLTSIVLFLFMSITAGIQLAEAQQPAYQDDDLTPELFSVILKEEWEYLRNATEQLDKETGTRGEFETTPEFQARAAKARRTAIEKLNAHIKENKLDKRVFGVWFALKLESYNADAGIYSVTCPTIVEAPYDIPTVICSVPHNQYIEMSDSIRGGYRKASIHFKFEPDFKWRIPRNEAMTAKANEANVFFKVHFVISMNLENLPTKAFLKIIPRTISIINRANKYTFWKENIQRTEVTKKIEAPVEDILEEPETESED
jgi:hypothetical protein